MKFEIAISIEPTSDNNRRMIRGALEYISLHPELSVFKRLAVPYLDWISLQTWNGAGIISGAEIAGSLNQLALKGTNIVSVSMHERPNPAIPTIGSDNIAIGRLAAEHLLQTGLRQFAFVGQSDWYHDQLRCEGFCQTLSQCGHDSQSINLDLVHAESQATGAYHNVGEYDVEKLTNEISKLSLPIGIVVAHDEFADAVYESCRNLKLRIPYDVAVVGVNNYRLVCESCDPPLSSIPQSAEKIGFEAARLLHRLINGENIQNNLVIFPPQPITMRRSSDFLAIEDQDVVEAIQLIRTQFHTKLTTEVVAEAVAIGRKTLDKRFVESLGHRVAEEIRLTRMRHAKFLLTTTEFQIIAIGLRCGYSSTSGFVRAFREETGQTPLKFQRQSRSFE
ncbi:MAG: LacI family transcriptional regulator [Mariniblastus sp.]|jgi:LacI family transcriptional regulator